MAKYYNGVLLPDIPAADLAKYPYVWIRKNDIDNRYEVVMAATPWYCGDASRMNLGSTQTVVYYTFPYSAVGTDAEWGGRTEGSWASFVLATEKTAIWSKYDIPYKTPSSTTFLIHGTEPTDALAPNRKVYYGYALLPEIPQEMLEAYPYAWIARGSSSTGLTFHPNGCYYDTTYKGLYDKGSARGPRYRLSADGESWELIDFTYSGFDISKSPLVWSNHDIPEGFATSEVTWFYASKSFLESDAKLVEIDYETNTNVYVGGDVVYYNANSKPLVSYVVPVEKGYGYKVTMNEIGNRLRAAFTATDPSTITTDATGRNIVNAPAFSVGYTFGTTAPADGWLVVYVSNAGETPDISIAKVVPGSEDEERIFGTAKVNGVAMPITGGMAKVNGVVLPITGGMVKTGGVVTPITM